MRDFVFSSPQFTTSSGITTTNNYASAVGVGFHGFIHSSLCPVSKVGELKDTKRTIPDNSLSRGDGFFEKFITLLSTIQTHKSCRDPRGIVSITNSSVFCKLISGDVINREVQFNIVLLGFFDQSLNNLSTILVKERPSDFHTINNLLEGVCHTTTNNHSINLIEQVVDQLNFITNLSTSQDGEERPVRVFQSLGEVIEFFLNQKSTGLLRVGGTDHGRVSAVTSTESIIHEHIS
mmetsp:Transcript_33896/g.53048  ORF Transcript_33896/g.53048 Transcript_33896/m.53048 type:complete len:235 (+) Transcript_33896:152-856(+)